MSWGAHVLDGQGRTVFHTPTAWGGAVAHRAVVEASTGATISLPDWAGFTVTCLILGERVMAYLQHSISYSSGYPVVTFQPMNNSPYPISGTVNVLILAT